MVARLHCATDLLYFTSAKIRGLILVETTATSKYLTKYLLQHSKMHGHWAYMLCLLFSLNKSDVDLAHHKLNSLSGWSYIPR